MNILKRKLTYIYIVLMLLLLNTACFNSTADFNTKKISSIISQKNFTLETDEPKTMCGISNNHVFDTFFAPYQDMLAPELEMINRVINAKKSDNNIYPEGSNPYSINYAVYNLKIHSVMNALIEAENNGVDVQILIEGHQFEKPWNDFDEILEQAGFEIVTTAEGLMEEELNTLDVIGINHGDYTAMHLKLRHFTWISPLDNQSKECMITGSGNPVNSALYNHEVMHVTNNDFIIEQYKAKYHQIKHNEPWHGFYNQWDNNSPVNVLFTGNGGILAIDKIMSMIDNEQDFIGISMFILHDIAGKADEATFTEKLINAHERGVKVIVVSDTYFTDPDSNKDNQTDEILQEADIPFYEVTNRFGDWNAMHLKAVVFGTGDNMKFVTGAGNWSRGGMGYRTSNNYFHYTKNDEDFIFINSKEFDNHKTGYAYLNDFLYLLETYENQQPLGTKTAYEIREELKEIPNWNDGGDWQQTVVFIYGETEPGQDMFIRGGIDHDYANDHLGRNCRTDNFECAVPIRHFNKKNQTTLPWKYHDKHLDWYGAERAQNSNSEGSPLDWTTNNWPSSWGETRYVNSDGFGESSLNNWGSHYWMLDVEMDCSKTANSWFELKSYISNGPGWENHISQSNTPYTSGNHFAKCGSLNVFKRNIDEPVTIESLQ